MDEKPLMKPFAFTRSWTFVNMSLTAGSDQAFGLPSKTFLKIPGPPIRSSRNSSHIMFVHRDWPPRENGAMPFELNVSTSCMISAQFLGGEETPAFSNTFLL